MTWHPDMPDEYKNQIVTGDCCELMKRIPSESVDLVVTSPPYDNLRIYNGYVFDFEGTATQLYRIIKTGGVIIWIIADQTIDGSETGTSFRHALYFLDIVKLNLHDTMIYRVEGTGAKGSNYSYWQAFEYMFVFAKGKPKTINRLKDRKNKKFGQINNPTPKSEIIGSRRMRPGITIAEFGYRTNVWNIHPTNGNDVTSHPAPFPERLAKDHILSWSDPGDIVLDPMCGSGTTPKMAKQTGRNWIGFDISEEYCELARKRVRETQPPLFVEQPEQLELREKTTEASNGDTQSGSTLG